MKAIVLLNGEVELQNLELRTLSSEWSRIRVVSVGLCGSDVAKISSRDLPASHTSVLGHEFVGQVIEANIQDRQLIPGDWVVGMPVLSCGRCYACVRHMENL